MMVRSGLALVACIAVTGSALAAPSFNPASRPVGAAGAASFVAAAQRRVEPAPVRDCTPFNGRYGYYANPWCSAREQAAWERRNAASRKDFTDGSPKGRTTIKD